MKKATLSKKWKAVLKHFFPFYVKVYFLDSLYWNYMSEHKYSKCTVEGDKKTKWICGCFLTIDGYFRFCDAHDTTLKKAIQSQIDELDMTLIVEN